MMQLFFIYLLMLGFNFAIGQVNLVPNGSFEEFDTCPPYNLNQNCALLDLATSWYNPTLGTPDYWHECAGPNDCAPWTTTSDGEGLIGMFTYGGGNNSREYASVALIEPLVADSFYVFSVHLKPVGGNNSVYIASYGAYFSQDSITHYIPNDYYLDLPAQLLRNQDTIMDDPNTWYVYRDTLVALGGERFLTIGNFRSDSLTVHTQHTWAPSGAHFIDDVSLVQIPKPNKPNSISDLRIDFTISPNPTSETVVVNSTHQLTAVWLTDLTGKRLELANNTGTKWQIDVSLYPLGIYLIEAFAENRIRSVQKVVVQ